MKKKKKDKRPQDEITSLSQLAQTHKIWKYSKKDLRWWKNETGNVGVNIRILCDIPLPHPDSSIQIACIYLLHLDYITQKNCEPAIFKYRAEVFEFLKSYALKYNLSVSDSRIFPWSLQTHCLTR